MKIRLTGGELSGRFIEGPKGEGVRPTSSRVRKSIFDILSVLEGLKVLDVFAGTGALGIESLSRGAGEATFIDRDTSTIKLNLGALGLDGRSRVLEMDADKGMDKLKAEGSLFDLILMDPPWHQGQSLAQPAWDLTAPGGRFLLEYASRRPVPAFEGLPEGRVRAYGDTSLIIFHKEGGA